MSQVVHGKNATMNPGPALRGLKKLTTSLALSYSNAGHDIT